MPRGGVGDDGRGVRHVFELALWSQDTTPFALLLYDF
jgi:hypothetical protein